MSVTPLSRKEFILSYLTDIILTIIGTGIFAFGIHFFIEPNNLAPGGVSGICIIISHVTGVSIGTLNLIINIPLFIIGLFKLGKNFMIKTLVSILSFSFFVNIAFANLPTYTEDLLLAAIFGGVLFGLGIGLVLSRFSSTGGMDIINKIVAKAMPHVKFGVVMLTGDLLIVAASMIVFQSLTSGLYAIIALFICSQGVNMVLYGLDQGMLLHIISGESATISKEIIRALDRGATILDGKGAYTGEKREVILCAIRHTQYYKIKKLVYGIDPDAFIIVSHSKEVMGEGFKSIDE